MYVEFGLVPVREIGFYFFRNSPSGKQYIDNAKHKLIMKISLESIDLAAGKFMMEQYIRELPDKN